MTIILQIIGFHNCDGCAQKVRIALRRIGVKLLELDRESGNVTIESSENPEVIKYALERQIKKSVVVQSRALVPTNQIPNSIVSNQVPANQTLDLQGLGQAMLRMAQVNGGVEITNWNAIRINFINQDTALVVRPEPSGSMGVRQIDRADVEYAPAWVATEPSAPAMPMHMEEQVVYGYPPDFYGFSTTRSHDHPNERCTIV